MTPGSRDIAPRRTHRAAGVAIALVALAAVIATAASLGSAATPRSEQRKALSNFTIVTSGGTAFTSIPVYYALSVGLFKKYGLNVKIVNVGADTDAVRALISGHADMIRVGAGAVMTAAQSSPTLQIVSSVAPEINYLFVANNSIKTFKDMEGKRLGVSSPSSVSYLVPLAVLSQAGVDTKSLQVISIGADADRVRALEAGRIDGAVANAEAATAGVKESSAIHIIRPRGGGSLLPKDRFLLTAIAVQKSTAQSKSREVTEAVAALMQACRILQKHKSIAVKFAYTHGDIADLEVLGKAYDFLTAGKDPFYGVNGGLNRTAYDATVQTLMSSGTLKSDVPWTEVVTTRFVKAAKTLIAQKTKASHKTKNKKKTKKK